MIRWSSRKGSPPQVGDLWQNSDGRCVLYVLGDGTKEDDVFTKRCLVIEHNDYVPGEVDVWDLGEWWSRLL